jgi:outer membrane biosynthesis protein TonB
MAMSASSSSGLSRQEALALFVALAAHVALIGGLTLAPPGKSIMSPPERMTVTFADEIADQSVSPDPNAEAAPDIAPVLGEPVPEPAPPEPAPVVPPPPKPAPQPVPQPKPQPAPRPAPKPVPQPRVMPAPQKPVAKPVAKPAPPKPAAAPVDARPRRRPDVPSGGSRLGNDFLSGIPGSTNPGTARTPPSDAMSPQIAASLNSEVQRQIKSRGQWQVPQGVDTDKLVTLVTFRLTREGNLEGQPTANTIGITASNQAQVKQHQERAIRAVRLTVPFQLPAKFYDGWKEIQAKFDRKLAL